jgi:signal transduction histidine kinase
MSQNPPFCSSDKARRCPFSKTTPCLDVDACPFHTILEDVGIGIVFFDLLRQKVIYQNKYAVELFKGTIHPYEYGRLSSLLMKNPTQCLGSGDDHLPRTLAYNDRLLGYTRYQINDHYYWVFIRDITDQRRLESVAEAHNMADNAGLVCSGIRHELGNPVNAMKMILSVLRENLHQYPLEKILNYVDRGLAEVSRMEYLLRSLKNFTMFERPKLGDVDVSVFMQQFLQLVATDLKDRGVSLKAGLPTEARWASIDTRALQQVLLNIISNALEAVNGRTKPEISVVLSKKDGYHVIAVSDNGRGISKDEEKNLFKPFFTSKPNGNGLGLVIARNMLAAMEGQIDIQSQERVGTTVTLRLRESRVENA